MSCIIEITQSLEFDSKMQARHFQISTIWNSGSFEIYVVCIYFCIGVGGVPNYEVSIPINDIRIVSQSFVSRPLPLAINDVDVFFSKQSGKMLCHFSWLPWYPCLKHLPRTSKPQRIPPHACFLSSMRWALSAWVKVILVSQYGNQSPNPHVISSSSGS